MQLMGLVSRSYAEATWSVMTLALQCTRKYSTKNRLSRVRIRREVERYANMVRSICN